MWPRVIPREIQADKLRSTECRVYRRLQEDLDDDFTVFYSRPWLGEKPDGDEIDGECDFVVAHPDYGFLALEVKGGAISYDPAADQWWTRDRWNYSHKIKDPVDQAVKSKHELIKKIRGSGRWPSGWITASHGVVFPDVERPEQPLGPNMPPELFCCLEEFDHGLREWILDRFEAAGSFRHNPGSMGREGIVVMEDILAHPFQLHVPLGRVLEQDEDEIETQTQQQYHTLELIGAIPRVAISGGAGTGKTVLAMEEAFRRSSQGLSVLYTCFNKPLAEEVRRRLNGRDGITIGTFHELCFRFARRAGLRTPDSTGLSQRDFDETLPDLLREALVKKTELRFDVIIVDEGQDFHSGWYSALKLALRETEHGGLFRIFYDSNQKVYGQKTSIPSDFEMSPIHLGYNLRNTRKIHRIVQNHYNGIPIRAEGPEGVEVKWLPITDRDDLRKKIHQRVTELTTNERVLPSDIAVLVHQAGSIPATAPTGKIGSHRTSRCDSPQIGSITLDTIRRFKGLESSVVILAATEELLLDEELLYVALSRARAHLIVLGDDRVLMRIEK